MLNCIRVPIYTEITGIDYFRSESSRMKRRKIVKEMIILAELIRYKTEDITYLAEAMCVNELSDGNTSDKKYSNGPLATLGDAVLKMIITEMFYFEEKDRGEITSRRMNIEKINALRYVTLDFDLQQFAYNDQYFFEEAPEDQKLPDLKQDVYIKAIIGAIYLDRGLKYCKKWIKSCKPASED